jgi:tRNA modification GTPase
MKRKVLVMQGDTIAAIATPLGEAGIAVIRVSGPDAVAVVDRLYQGKTPLREAKSHTIHYGYLVDPASGERLDEVLISVMKAPRTYTREDVVEVNCHGGLVVVRRVLQAILKHGARLAEPGEFTKRAFLNGRLDLSQAEAVIDLIRSKTDRARKIALKQVEGQLSKRINQLRQTLIETLAHIEVTIDYPEHDVQEVTQSLLRERCKQVRDEIGRLLETAEEGKILREGLKTTIIGLPNVGKSSLLNALIKENKAIVTDIPGTTRDVIEEYVNIKGIPLHLIDTAGIRETEDVVERIGVERSRQALEEADLILFVLNRAEPLRDEEVELLEKVREMNTILIVNKADLQPALDVDDLRKKYPELPLIEISVKEGLGLDQLEQAIADFVYGGRLGEEDLTYVSNSRHIALLHEAQAALGDALVAIEEGMPVDLVQIDIQQAWEKLGEIVGETVSEALIDQLFSQFCLGK